MTGSGDTKTQQPEALTTSAKLVAYSEKLTEYPARMALDANILHDLVSHELANVAPRPGQPRRGKKQEDLVGCLARLRSNGTKILMTPAVLEEVLHVLVHQALEGFEEKMRCPDCSRVKERDRHRALRKHHESEYADLRLGVLKVFKNAIVAAKKHGARVWLADGSGDGAGIGEKVLEAFVGLMGGCARLDGKDALHIVTAARFECSAFASRDGGFRHVPNLTVFCPTV